MDQEVTLVHFSPGGTTHLVGSLITEELQTSYNSQDLLQKNDATQTYTAKDLVIFALPVFAGRLPALCLPELQKITSEGTLAVAVVVYGNRDYEDALLELTDILSDQGFKVIAAAAFIARHSIFPQIAAQRPDHDDRQKISQFARSVREVVQLTPSAAPNLVIKGTHPYKTGGPIPLFPVGSKACTNCQICVTICPVSAIPAENPRKTDTSRCVSCTACIYHCPVKARHFAGIKYQVAKQNISAKCTQRREPDIYLPQ